MEVAEKAKNNNKNEPDMFWNMNKKNKEKEEAKKNEV